MAAGRGRAYVVERADQLRVLRSPLRQEIVDALVASGPRSVAELAGILGRPADALYYHVRRLQRVGLLVTSGRRRSGARTEEIVDAVGRPVALPRGRLGARHRDAIQSIVASMLRLTTRQHAAALRRGSPAGRSREAWAARVSGWLSPAERDALMHALKRLSDAFQRRRRNGRRRLHALTFVVAPLDDAARRTRRRRGPGW